MKRVANIPAIAAWKEWSEETKFDLWSNPQAEELSVMASIQLWGVMDPSRISTQHLTIDARNSNVLLDTRPWR